MSLVVICSVLGVLATSAIVVVLILAFKLKSVKGRFATIIDADAEAARIVKGAKQKLAEADNEAANIVSSARRKILDAEDQAARILAEAQRSLAQVKEESHSEQRRLEALGAEYTRAKSTFDRLNVEVRDLEENLEDISFGLYKPHYKFDTPEGYKRELDRVNEQQKRLIRDQQAATFSTAWTINGSTKEGAKMQKQYVKLMLRAFNGECDAAVAKVSWNNATKMEERIQKAFDAINQLGGVMNVTVSARYRDLKLSELRIEHELEEKKREIAEEQRRIREQMREEERAQREAERAESEAEAEEKSFQKAYEKAIVDLSKSKGEEHRRLNDKLVELEAKLAEARSKHERAKSLAQLTKVGYVYVLSNVGSFGDGVFKIGMTRRLDPMDRVKELGDASVPFAFDVHAMVYTEDAPALECAFHQEFANRSVNLVNMRTEFFHVTLEELERFATARGLTISFTKLAEAREYRESLEIRKAREKSRHERKPSTVAFPDSLVS
jgi:hypothetical protein